MFKKIIKIFEKIADGITNFILSIGNLLTFIWEVIISPILTLLAWVGFVILALCLLRVLVRFLIG